MNGRRSNIREYGGLESSKEPLLGCNQAEKRHLIIWLFYEWHWNKAGILVFSSPSSCLPALEAARPSSAPQFSVQEQTKRQGLFITKSDFSLFILPVCTVRVYGSGAVSSIWMFFLKNSQNSGSWIYCAYLLQIPIALHRLWQFGLEPGQAQAVLLCNKIRLALIDSNVV